MISELRSPLSVEVNETLQDASPPLQATASQDDEVGDKPSKVDRKFELKVRNEICTWTKMIIL